MTTSRTKKSNRPLILAIIVILSLAGIFLLYNKFQPQKQAITDDQELSWEPEDKAFPAENLQDSQPIAQGTKPPAPSIAAIKQPAINPEKKQPCQETAQELKQFLGQLSSQNYIEAYELPEGLSEHLNSIIIKLLNNPPIITSESDDMYTILKNSAHFYRIL